MTLRFRPLPGFTILAALMFALLLALGFWQLHRLQWKLALIAEMAQNMHTAPLSMGQVEKIGVAAAQYHRVTLRGHYLNYREVYIFATDPKGGPIYHVWTPLLLEGGGIMMIDRGVVPPALRDPHTRPSGQLEGERLVAGVLRIPDGPGLFTPAPQLAQHVWYAKDLPGVARAEHLILLAPVIIEADAAPNPGGWPRGGQTVVALPNDHLQYAITWFLLAGCLVVVYLVYHRARGRLQLSLL
jgi:surfeit locus 1 family protein